MKRFRDWLAAMIFLHVPLLPWRVHLWLLPYAGNWAHGDDYPEGKERG